MPPWFRYSSSDTYLFFRSRHWPKRIPRYVLVFLGYFRDFLVTHSVPNFLCDTLLHPVDISEWHKILFLIFCFVDLKLNDSSKTKKKGFWVCHLRKLFCCQHVSVSMGKTKEVFCLFTFFFLVLDKTILAKQKNVKHKLLLCSENKKQKTF